MRFALLCKFFKELGEFKQIPTNVGKIALELQARQINSGTVAQINFSSWVQKLTQTMDSNLDQLNPIP